MNPIHSFFLRLAEFTGGKEEKRDKLKKPRSAELIQTSLADRFNQLQDAENAWKKKVSCTYRTNYVSNTLFLFL